MLIFLQKVKVTGKGHDSKEKIASKGKNKL